MKNRHVLLTALVTALLLLIPQIASSHCQIPCGIYDDELRLNLLAEHITTIEKSMNLINTISASEEINYNQLVRWTNNKEDHADQFSEIVTKYFMAQRIAKVNTGEEGYNTYVNKITLLHQMLRTTMKCKQTSDLANTATLSKLLAEFKALYMAGHEIKR